MIKGTTGATRASKLSAWRAHLYSGGHGALAGGTDSNFVEMLGKDGVEVKEDDGTNHSSHLWCVYYLPGLVLCAVNASSHFTDEQTETQTVSNLSIATHSPTVGR